ncbi:SDR family oxidoreductase [Priestia filamentosa]|uniref:SDR family oxidoreductase n=1 Tax=Priestia filamentosa TaxID=1402861 RepID=UPI00234B5AC6|nr:SDR family oxidoreductase [Priestia filamentosa]WCM16727.1 SDR family oxidoreductase [Priestia filamentosa]
MDLQLKGKNAVVLAGSQGLGEAIVEGFVKEGTNVIIASRSEDKLAQICKELTKKGESCVLYQKTDITKPEDIEVLLERVKAEFGSLDILINNSGGPKAGTLNELTDEDFYNAFELNLLSYVRSIRAFFPLLKEKGGKIINIASSSIKEPIEGLLLSNVFRTGVVGLTKTIAGEFAPYNILVNTVAPGRIATARVEHLDEVRAEKQGKSIEQVGQEAKAGIPLGRYGEPREFANVVLFLSSDANTYMTGSSFLVDGGAVKSI